MDPIQFAPDHATRIGQQFGSYLIERPLGRGAFATVFLGRHVYLDMNAAIKIPHLASDQYALAVVLYEVLCGIPPFVGTRTAIVEQHLCADPLPLRERGLSIPHAVEDVIIQALAKDPEQRFGSAGQFAMALELAVRESSRTVHIPPHEEEPWRSSTPAGEPVAARRCPPRPETKAARWFTIGAMCSGALMFAVLIWSFTVLPHSNAQDLAWLVAFWLIGCAFTSIIIMKGWQALQIFGCIFALALLSGFVFHTMLAFLAATIILLASSLIVTLILSLREA